MFDDPKKELRRLEEALLAEGFDEAYDPSVEEMEPEYDPEYDWELEALLEPNEAVDFGRMAYADEDFDEDAALLADTGSRGRKRKETMKQKKGGKPVKKQKKGIGGLVLLALLELLGIAWLVRWWILWLT